MARLKLRDDAYYVPTADGIFILTSHDAVVLTGSSIFGWVDRLAPYLDGRHTLAELTAAMPADRKDMTERVIGALRGRGVVSEVCDAQDRADRLTGQERWLYRREIGFLGYFCSQPERSFLAYRDSLVVLAGAGQMLAETAEAALSSGSRRLRVAVTGECATDMSLLAGCERRARQRDPGQQVTRTELDLTNDKQLSEVLAGAGIVVYACDCAGAGQVRALDRACARAGIPFMAAIPDGDRAWLGPFGSSEPTDRRWPGWTSAWRRLLARQAVGCPDSSAAPGGLRAKAAATVVANQVIREAVRRLAGTADDCGPARMIQVDLRSLRSRSHPFLAHPFARAVPRPDPAAMLATVDRLRAGGPLDAAEVSRRVAACQQPCLGLLGEVSERDFAQAPLAVSQVIVSDPVRLRDPGAPFPSVIGTGLSAAESRLAAVLRGLAVYGSLMVDPRRLHVHGDASGVTGDPDRDLAALRAGKRAGFAWGYSLADGLPHAVAAAEVFPALRGLGPGYTPPPGAAAGFGWEEAVRAGLIGQCRRLTLAELADGRGSCAPVDWTGIEMDAHGGRYLSILKTTGRQLGIYDVTGPVRVPTLAFCLDGITVAYSSGFSFGEAMRQGLREVLQYYQAEVNHEPEYRPAPVPPLPAHLSPPSAHPGWATGTGLTVARLADLGWTPVAVPLDHDPALMSILPHLVNVVLTRG